MTVLMSLLITKGKFSLLPELSHGGRNVLIGAIIQA